VTTSWLRASLSLSRSASSGERAARSAGSPSSMLAFYSNSCSITSPFLNKIREIWDCTRSIRPRPRPEADHDHITQRPFAKLTAHPGAGALRSAQGKAQGTSPKPSAQPLADLQLVAHRNQMPLHLLTGRLGITPTQYGQ